MDTQETTPNKTPKTHERTLVLKTSEADFRRFSVGRAKLGLKTAEYLTYLLDLAEAQPPTE